MHGPLTHQRKLSFDVYLDYVRASILCEHSCYHRGAQGRSFPSCCKREKEVEEGKGGDIKLVPFILLVNLSHFCGVVFVAVFVGLSPLKADYKA